MTPTERPEAKERLDSVVKHTPTPWFVHQVKDRNYCQIGYGNGPDKDGYYESYIIDNYGDWCGVEKANAEFIVRACNAHDDLVAKLKDCLAWVNDPYALHREAFNRRLAKEIEAVLAKARSNS